MTIERHFHPVYEMATPMTHEIASSATSDTDHVAWASRSCSCESAPAIDIGTIESTFVYMVGPHMLLSPRCGPTMCFPYAISTEMITKYADTHV